MQPSPKFRHIRLLIEKGELSEALTELLLLMRQLKASGYEVDDLIEKRKILVLKSEDSDLKDRLGELLQQLFERVKGTEENKEINPMPPARDKGGSILSKMLDSLGLGKRKSRSAPVDPKPSIPGLEEAIGSSDFEKKSKAAEVAERMREADPEASLQGAKTLNLPIKRKSPLEFRLSIENWHIEDSVQVLTWFGIPSSVEFEVRVPETFQEKQAIGSLLIKGGEGALGRVRFINGKTKGTFGLFALL